MPTKRTRRRRDAPPTPWSDGLRIAPGSRDELLLQELQWGALPAHYLFPLTKERAKNYGRLQNRLTELYHGFCVERGHVRDDSGRLPPDHTCIPFSYLGRPADQQLTRNADEKPIIYTLADNSVELLRERGLLSPFYKARRPGWWVHDFMGSCVAASIKIAAREAGLKYLDLDDIFGHKSCPEETRQSANPLSLPLSGGTHVVPDGLFGIEFPTEPKPSRAFYAVEIDRSSETIRPGEHSRKKTPNITEKFEAYKKVFETRAYQDHWGIRNLQLLIVTNNASHVDGIAECAEEIFPPDYLHRIAIRSKSEFGKVWTVPEVMRDLFTESWKQPGGTFFQLNQL